MPKACGKSDVCGAYEKMPDTEVVKKCALSALGLRMALQVRFSPPRGNIRACARYGLIGLRLEWGRGGARAEGWFTLEARQAFGYVMLQLVLLIAFLVVRNTILVVHWVSISTVYSLDGPFF